MKDSPTKNCPICETPDSETIHALGCGNFDNSKLYPTVRLKICLHCGHAFNDLSQDEFDRLNQYYNDEYAPTNLNAIDMKGDRPGSTGNLTNDRYDQLYATLLPHIYEQHEILDVGCAIGGFLDYLSRKGFRRLTGVDMTETYVDQAKAKNLFRIERGNAEYLPFADHSVDVVVIEQVLEHLGNPLRAFQEARRVLRKDGILCIGVPDASRYADFYFFDYYWLLLREHIQHFDVEHLNSIAIRGGFKMLEYRQTAHAVMSAQMIMPNLYAIFRVSDSVNTTIIKEFNNAGLKQYMVNYIDQEKARQLIKSRKIAELSNSRRPVYAWGIGREFLYLYEAAELKYCNIIGLIDMNQLKQKTCSVNGIKIEGADSLRISSADSVLLITGIAHTNSIKHAVKALDFKGEILDLDIFS